MLWSKRGLLQQAAVPWSACLAHLYLCQAQGDNRGVLSVVRFSFQQSPLLLFATSSVDAAAYRDSHDPDEQGQHTA